MQAEARSYLARFAKPSAKAQLLCTLFPLLPQTALGPSQSQMLALLRLVLFAECPLECKLREACAGTQPESLLTEQKTFHTDHSVYPVPEKLLPLCLVLYGTVLGTPHTPFLFDR